MNTETWIYPETARVADLRRRVRAAMDEPPAAWHCPERIPVEQMNEPLAVRKARAMALKLAHMPLELWDGQLIAGSMTLESPRVHAEWGFPDYVTDAEREAAAARRSASARSSATSCRTTRGCWRRGWRHPSRRGGAAAACAIRRRDRLPRFGRHRAGRRDGLRCASGRALRCGGRPLGRSDSHGRAAADGRQPAPGAHGARADLLAGAAVGLAAAHDLPCHHGWQRRGPARPVLLALPGGRPGGRASRHGFAAELADCFCLKFNERAKTTDEQRPEARQAEEVDPAKRTRHSTSSQIGATRDRLDATNHWLQNIIIGGLTPEGGDGTNPLTFLLLNSYDATR